MSVEAIDIDLTDPETAKAATTIQVLKLTLLINFLRGPFINSVDSFYMYPERGQKQTFFDNLFKLQLLNQPESSILNPAL